MSMTTASLPPASEAGPPRPPDGGGETGHATMTFSELWENKQGFTFSDFLDIINPLQHLPIISTIYRNLTGDEIGFAPRLIGGGLFGGPVGFGSAVLTVAAEEATGDEPANQLIAAIRGVFGTDDEVPQNASAAEPASEPAPQAAPPKRDAPSPEPAAEEHSAAPLAPAPVALHLPSAAHQAPKTADQGSAAAAERARIAQKVLAAQRAQANILLASLAPDRANGDADARDDGRADEPARDDASQHSNIMPADANPEWIGRAMERALDKYEQTFLQRGGGDASLPIGP